MLQFSERKQNMYYSRRGVFSMSDKKFWPHIRLKCSASEAPKRLGERFYSFWGFLQGESLYGLITPLTRHLWTDNLKFSISSPSRTSSKNSYEKAPIPCSVLAIGFVTMLSALSNEFALIQPLYCIRSRYN